jgi:hypothetical protein
MRALRSKPNVARGFIGLLGTQADSRSLSRPSLKITRHEGQTSPDNFTFEVWSPFTGSYQPAASIEEGLQRADELASLICQMWLQKHPKHRALTDTPDADVIDSLEWAEVRVNATRYRSYDTRRFDRPTWVRATGMAQAAETICNRVGYKRRKAIVP